MPERIMKFRIEQMRGSTKSFRGIRTATLSHKIWNHPVETKTIPVIRFRKANKRLFMLRSLMVQGEPNIAFGCLDSDNLMKAAGKQKKGRKGPK
jgi:hypothetical protein